MKLITGSKTFLVGEYAVLFGGAAVVLINRPNFELDIRKGKTELLGISKSTPAYRLYDKYYEKFSGLRLKFRDPHKIKGGLGSSSAQYVLLYKLLLKQFLVDDFLDEFRSLSEFKGVPPSGADCLAQYFNHHIYYDSASRTVKCIDWKFPNLDFIVVRTMTKVFTHSHLKKLEHPNVQRLKFFVDCVKNSFITCNEKMLIQNVQDFFYELENLGLVIPKTSAMVREILNLKYVRAAKGCGALAADTILIIFERGHRAEVLKSSLEVVYRFLRRKRSE